MTMQLTLNLQANLTQDYASLRKAVQAACFQYRGGIAKVAAAGKVDMSPSQLGRKCEGSEDDPHRSLDMDDLEHVLDVLAEQKIYLPILYLCAKYLPTDSQRQIGVLEQFAGLMGQASQMMPAVAEALAAAKAGQ